MFWLFSTKPRKTVYANCRECKVHLFTRRLFRFVSKSHLGSFKKFMHMLKRALALYRCLHVRCLDRMHIYRLDKTDHWLPATAFSQRMQRDLIGLHADFRTFAESETVGLCEFPK